jgi:hypothetical protein
MKRSSFLWGIFLSAMWLLSACGAVSTPTATPVPTAKPTETLSPSETFTPTLTETPSPTPTSTVTLTPSQTPVPSNTPGPDFASFLLQYTQAVPNGTSFGFRIPGIKQPLLLKVNNFEYKCTVTDKTPDFLYCTGKQFNQNQSVKLVFLPLNASATDKSLFETTIKIAYEKTPTPDPRDLAAQAPSCPDRGKNVRGEIEWRKYNGSYCVVATCFDACGYYYSMNTCPSGTDHNGIFQFPGPTPVVCK